MNYCTKCGKPTNNGIVCEDCIILDSPWLLAMKSKEYDLVEQIEQLKSENAELRARLKEAKQRAEVAERALATVCEEVLHARYPVESVTVSVVDDFIQRALREAEKELEEEE